MTPKQVLKHYRTKANIARALGIKPPSVAAWFRVDVNQIPILRQHQIQTLTRGKLRAD